MPMTTSSMPAAPPCLDEVIEQRDQCIAALQREALLADVLGVQVALQPFGGGELPQNVAPLLGA